MKKTLFFSSLILICISFFSVQSFNAGINLSLENSSQSISIGWEIKLAPDTENFVNIYFKTENSGCIYTGHQPVKRTTDGGNSWGYGTTAPSTFIDNGVSFNGSDIFLSAYIQQPNNEKIGFLYRSTDMGLNWGISAQATCLQPPITIYGFYKNIGYITKNCYPAPNRFKTNDGGNSWYWLSYEPPDSIGFSLPLSVSYIDTNIIYGIKYTGLVIGKYVTGLNNGAFNVLKRGVFSKICDVDDTNIIALSGVKIFRSTNAGINWDSATFPVVLNSISFPDHNTGYMTGNNGKIYKSTNKGITWISQITPVTDNLVDCCFLNSSTGYVIGANGTLLKTNDGGGSNPVSISGSVLYSDNNQPATSGYVKAIKLDKPTGNIITYDSVQIQPNGNYILTNVPQDSIDIGVYPNSTTQNDWVVTYYPSTIYWQNATTLYPTGNLTNINVGAIRLTSSTNNNSVNGKVMRLNDNPSLANLKDAVLYAKSGNTFVRCGISGVNGVYHLPSLPAGSLKIICNRMGFTGDSTTVNVTSTSNIDSINFYLYKLPVGIKQIENIIPSEYKLYQNYPNPFNPTTNIRYQITNSKLVTLKVYDILGKEIATLVNEKQSPGVYEVTFDGNDLPSGIYFYKLMSGEFKATKRFVLIK